ncbi:MAG: replicative DNA helicase [Acutalibacteraceae bacterium]
MADNELLNTEGGLLPFSLEAEQAVLGSVLIDPSCVVTLADILKADNFYLPQHVAIYNIIWDMYSMSKPIDPVTVLEELKKQGVYDDAGGKSYLLQLAQGVPTTANVESYANIIKEKYYVRSLILAAREIISSASNADVDANLLLDRAEQSIYEIRQGRENGGLKSLREVITGETMDRIDKLSHEETRAEFEGISTGFSGIDRMTTGLHKSDLIILGARPGMGKTSMALNLAANVASREDKPTVCIFSLEMTREQLAERLIANEASIVSTKLRTGQLDGDEWKRFAQACDLLSNTNIYLDETSNITVPEIKARLRRMRKVDLVIIDYLGLMHSSKEYNGNRALEMAEITRNLKIMAKELMVPVIACAQLNRGTEAKGKSHRPALSDLRDSGSIEQDADSCWFLYREMYYASDSGNPEELDNTKAECIIAKNRHGEVGTVYLHWDGQFTRFTTPAYIREEE